MVSLRELLVMLLDAYGTPIREGSKVAFNLSGELRIGVVTGFEKSGRYYMNGRPLILVEEQESGKVSKMTRPVNVVVIDKEEVRVRVCV